MPRELRGCRYGSGEVFPIEVSLGERIEIDDHGMEVRSPCSLYLCEFFENMSLQFHRELILQVLVGYTAVIRDISARKRKEQRSRYLEEFQGPPS